MPQSITQKTKINIQSYIFGVQHKSVIELTLLQIGGLNNYDKIVCHSCLYNSSMYCLCNLITLTQMLYLSLISQLNIIAKFLYLIFLRLLVFLLLLDRQYRGNILFQERQLNELKIRVAHKQEFYFAMNNLICNYHCRL